MNSLPFTKRNAPLTAEFVLALREWEDNASMEIRSLHENGVIMGQPWIDTKGGRDGFIPANRPEK